MTKNIASAHGLQTRIAELLGHARAVQLILAFLMLGILLGSCAEEADLSVPDGAPGASDGAPSTPPWPPTECAGLVTPFRGEACLQNIRDICRSHQDKQGCVRQGKVDAGGGFIVFCNWVPVVQFTDDVSCIVESSSWRCEGHLDLSLDVCADPCEVSPELHYAWKAMFREREMINVRRADRTLAFRWHGADERSVVCAGARGGAAEPAAVQLHPAGVRGHARNDGGAAAIGQRSHGHARSRERA